MTIHYHGTPITPNDLIMKMAGGHFCVSHAAPAQVRRCHKIGQSVMLDNGAFSVWKRGHVPDWPAYYAWCDRWLDYPTTWAVIPDEIEGDEDANRRLVDQWPYREQGAPVWHMHESFHRLLGLIHAFPRVCIGSSGQYAEVMSMPWQRQMDAAWEEIVKVFKRTPNIHMLRGLRLANERWPFASLDSTNIARNHAGNNSGRPRKCTVDMMRRLDADQCPSRFVHPDEQWEAVL